MQKGQTGIYRSADGTAMGAVVLRPRGADQADIDLGGSVLQMVDKGTRPGQFEPHGHDVEGAPPPPLRQRLVPRYIPIWHAIVLGVPVAGGTAVLCELLWHWLVNR